MVRLLSPVFAMVLFVAFFAFVVALIRRGEAETDALKKELEEALESKRTCDLRMISLYHGQCDATPQDQCERVWAKLDSRVTDVSGIAPIGCPLVGTVPWVNPKKMNPDEWSFTCVPEVAP